MSDVLLWQVNTPGLLQEILDGNPSASILRKPLNIFGKLLAEVGERAAELDDPVLNDLMCRLAIYSIGDPYSADYDAARVAEIRARAKRARGAGPGGRGRRAAAPVFDPGTDDADDWAIADRLRFD